MPSIVLGGKNLLLFGENGSGKSTIFNALSQLLDLGERQPFNHDLADARCLKNRFTDPMLPSGRVVLLFTQTPGAAPVLPMAWHIDNARPNNHAFFRSMGRTRGFLDYRALLQTHFVHRDHSGINLFTLVIQSLLRDVEYPNNGPEFGQEWDEIQKAGHEWLDLAVRDVSKMDDAEKILYGLEPPESEDGKEEANEPFDESAAFQQFVASQRETVEKRIKGFNDALWQRVLEIQTIANTILARFDSLISIDFAYEKPVKLPEAWAPDNWPGEPKLLLRARFRNELLEHPGAFLNEARLTAIALAFYFAALKVEVPDATATTDPAPRILVLDDVLIGLDLAHRLPVLKVLEEEFVQRGWQVLLFTYDRVWYELAQLGFENPDRWTSAEIHCGEVNENGRVIDAPILKPQAENLAEHFLNLAENHLKPPRCDLRTAALHARAAFEAKLKSYCSKRKLPVPYDLDGRRLTTDHFLQTVEASMVSAGTMPRMRFAIQRVALFRKGVLNPLAHFHPVTLDSSEVAAAIRAVKELRLSKETDAKQTDYAAETAAALAVAAPTTEQVLDAAAWLRTTFEVDLRKFLVRCHGRVVYREAWDKLTLGDLWASAKEAMQWVNPAAAASLIGNIEHHPSVFLNEWRYSDVKALTKAALDAAWSALKDPASLKTRLATFR